MQGPKFAGLVFDEQSLDHDQINGAARPFYVEQEMRGEQLASPEAGGLRADDDFIMFEVRMQACRVQAVWSASLPFLQRRVEDGCMAFLHLAFIQEICPNYRLLWGSKP